MYLDLTSASMKADVITRDAFFCFIYLFTIELKHSIFLFDCLWFADFIKVYSMSDAFSLLNS